MIENVIQTQRALLVWQSPLDQHGSYDRIPVAEIVDHGGVVSFRYFEEDRLNVAKDQGFKGYPGLPFATANGDSTSMDVLIRRLPPKQRDDFGEILERFGLPANGAYSDLSLLAYTGARLTSDTFSICETFDGFEPPFTYLFDVAGYRHNRRESGEIESGDPVRFVRERNNSADANAVRIDRADGSKVGYVNRLQAEKVGEWLDEGAINASVLRINGRVHYPRMFVLAEILDSRGSVKA